MVNTPAPPAGKSEVNMHYATYEVKKLRIYLCLTHSALQALLLHHRHSSKILLEREKDFVCEKNLKGKQNNSNQNKQTQCASVRV